MHSFLGRSIKQDGRLAPAYLSPNYKYFDQFLQTVKKRLKTKLLFWYQFSNSFYKSIPPLISVLYAKGYNDFPLKNFRLTVPKNFVEEPFCVSENFWYRKNLWIRGGRGGGKEHHDFLSKIFCLTVPKNFVGEPFSVSLISGIEKFYAYEGNITIFYGKFAVSQYRKTS